MNQQPIFLCALTLSPPSFCNSNFKINLFKSSIKAVRQGMYKMQVLSRTPSPKPPAMGKKLGVNSQPFPTPSPNSPVPPMNGINHKSKPIATGYSPGFQKVRTLRMNFPVSLSKEGSVRQGLFLMRMTLKMTHQKSYWNVGSQQG